MLRQRPFPHELNTMLVLAQRVPFRSTLHSLSLMDVSQALPLS